MIFHRRPRALKLVDFTNEIKHFGRDLNVLQSKHDWLTIARKTSEINLIGKKYLHSFGNGNSEQTEDKAQLFVRLLAQGKACGFH